MAASEVDGSARLWFSDAGHWRNGVSGGGAGGATLPSEIENRPGSEQVRRADETTPEGWEPRLKESR